MVSVCNAKYDVAEMCKWAGDNYACNFPEFCGSKMVNAHPKIHVGYGNTEIVINSNGTLLEISEMEESK